jgi:hypothetical protein
MSQLIISAGDKYTPSFFQLSPSIQESPNAINLHLMCQGVPHTHVQLGPYSSFVQYIGVAKIHCLSLAWLENYSIIMLTLQ